MLVVFTRKENILLDNDFFDIFVIIHYLDFIASNICKIQNSTGLQIEYIAVFLAIIFPGALVAFNYDLLQSLPRFSMLRIYCAGIWLNAVVRNVNFSCICPIFPNFLWFSLKLPYASVFFVCC